MLTSILYESAGTLEQGCPRCKSKGTVALLRFKRPVKMGLGVLLVAVLAGHWLAPEYDFEGQLIAAAVGFLEVAAGTRTKCTACNASLQKEIGNGWR